MSNNREKRVPLESVHILSGIMRSSKGSDNSNCVRQVVRDYDLDLAILESKLKVMGGEWRIYHTVNARDVQKARLWLLHYIIDHPDHASYIDSDFRTALLQRDCMAEKKFMLDVDTQEEDKLDVLHGKLIEGKVNLIEKHKSPKGWHYITEPFDTREVCALGYVTLLRDGYYYVKTVNKKETTERCVHCQDYPNCRKEQQESFYGVLKCGCINCECLNEN